MRLDWQRLLRAAALLAWAGFFDWLWLSGRASDYVGPRTAWVVPFGGLVLTAVALLHLRGLRTREPGAAPGPREYAAVAALLAPLLLVAAAPSSSLGALAVDRKRTADDAGAASRLDTAGALTLYDVAAANSSADYARQRGVRAGVRVDFDGLVSGAPENGRMELSRFLASCCAADAIPYSVTIVLPPDAPDARESDWYRVRGRLEPDRDGLIVAAEALEAIDRPDNPYGY